MSRFLFIMLLCTVSSQQIQFAQSSSRELVSDMDSSLIILVKLQKKVKDIYPCLKKFHPVAVPYNDSLLIFDYNSTDNEYRFIKETAQPFPLPEGIQASFPLSVYDNKPTCIVNRGTFSKPAGFITVLHEFIHCCQYSGVEPGLKQSLDIYNTAMKNKDYSWEIMHPFPYNDSLFVSYYEIFKDALVNNDNETAKIFRHKLKAYLSKTDFEYMLWEEWKEGLARYVENKINERLKFDRNEYGKNKPYDRISFYYSGELLIKRLMESDQSLPDNMKLLFEKMRDF